MDEGGGGALFGLLAHIEPEVVEEEHIGAEFFFGAAVSGGADDVAAGDAGAVGLQDALQAEALFVGGNLAEGRWPCRSGGGGEVRSSPVVICQQAFDAFQATPDRVEAGCSSSRQFVDALALDAGGDGGGDNDGRGDLKERLLPPAHMPIVEWGCDTERLAMNLKEGMRRTGILIGVLGACAGVVLAYADALPLWSTWREHRRFQALLDTPTVRKATGANWFAKHAPDADKWCDVDPSVKLPEGFRLVDPCYETSAADKGKLHWIEVRPWERDWSKEPPARGQIVKTVFRLESFAPDANRDGINAIHYDVGGTVTSIELATGERIERPRSLSALRVFGVPLLFPLVGFLLPWGATKSIAWVVTGFMASKGV